MIPSFLLEKEQTGIEPVKLNNKLPFIDKTIKNMAAFITASLRHWHLSRRSGVLQAIDPRVKTLFMLGMIVLISFSHNIASHVIIAGFIIFLFIASKLDVINAYKKIALFGFLFGFLIFLPASLNIFTKGEPYWILVRFSKAHSWWIYNVPREISITREGIFTVLQLSMKVVNSISVVMLIISSTGFEKLIKAFAFFKVPGIFLLTLTMSYKYIFVLSGSIEESYMAMKMRWWIRDKNDKSSEIVAGRMAYLFRKSWERYELVYKAMISRGFNGSINFYFFGKLSKRDFYFSTVGLLFIVSIIYINVNYA